jgi:hypothetical protein
MPVKETYKRFCFDKWAYRLDKEEKKLVIDLHYSLDKKLNFKETLAIPVTWKKIPEKSVEALENAIAALHIIGGISYFKTYLPREMEGLELTEEQAAFWKKVYERGLGEFFYKNNIDFRGIVNFPVSGKAKAKQSAATPLKETCLVPIGGGKDSIVTAQILKKAGVDFTLFSLRDADPIANTTNAIGKPRIVVDRQLDNQLFQLNEQGALNGHVPITAFISFLAVVCAIAHGHKFLVLSLEKSANYGQLIFHGMDINHQYSKSEEFEEDFRNYVKKHIHSQIEYFSLLRGFSELKIAKIFAGFDDFDRFSLIFTSCNANFKIHKTRSSTLWCCDCPKCLFVYIILAPFLEKQKMVEMFGQNLLERHDLLGLFDELLGQKNFKPFECVGTLEESQLALKLISCSTAYRDDLLVRHFNDKILPKLVKINWPKRTRELLSLGETPFIPKKFLTILKQYE